MKKFFLLALLAILACRSFAQGTATFVLVSNPCDTNKILAINFSVTGTPPYTVSWPSNSTYTWGIHNHTVTGLTDTLFHYDGAAITVDIYVGSTLAGSGTYAGVATPFKFTFAPNITNCTAVGTASVTVIGGTPPFSYYWYKYSTPSIVAGTTNPVMLPAAIGLSDIYGITIVDAAGCITGSQDTIISYSHYPYWDTLVSTPTYTQSVTSNPAVCPATLGSGFVSVSGGVSPFSYSWTNATTGAVTSGTTLPASLPGNYGYNETTTDSHGCISSGYAYLGIVPDFTQSVTITPAVCPGMGSGTVFTTGGAAPFSYSWTNTITGVITVSSISTVSLTGGYWYYEETTDALGCSVGYENNVFYTPDFTATVTTTSANCTNGTASVAITGGTAPFSYLWSNGATTASISGLITGTYSLKLTDALGCADSAAIDPHLSGHVAQSITITLHDVVTPATCIATNGSIISFGSGGMPPYSYIWSNGATTATISGLASGVYTVTATDANGCLGWGGSNVTSSTPITVTYATTPSSCTAPTGTATLYISGGTAPYTITWYTTPVQTTPTATSLSVGNYYFTITDAVGCTQHGTVTVPPIDVINLSFTSSAATCLASNGSVSVSATGGVAPYTYSWSSGGTTASLSGVPYGIYYATVTDAHGCSVTNCQQVPYSSPLVLGLSSTPASCLYTSNGTITATASLGTPPYNYSMGGSASGSVTIPGLAKGSYWIHVTDAIGCNAWQYTYVNYNVSDSSCFCVVHGKVYDDLAANCTPAGDPGIQNIQLHASGFGYTYSDDSGDYYFLLPSGSYNISQTVLSIYPLSPCQLNNIPVTVVAATGCYNTINFADTLNPIHDMHICTWDYSKPRPGFPYTQTTIVKNNGTLTEPNILASYVPDGQLLGPTFVPSGVFTGAPYYYTTSGTFPSLAPGVGQQFLATYNVPADIPLGTNVIFKDTVAYAPPMSNWLNDYSPWDNVDYFITTTVGAYDPNFKEVSPKGYGANGTITTADSVLEYMVHFQNVGTYMAENVVVKDTLDANLDWTTLRPVYMSDKCVVDLNDNGIATFTFNHIDLPPSSSQPVTSNAMFTYTIKQKPGLPIGAQIKNHASIYFDFNAPVMTNTTLNTIGWPESVTTVGSTKNNSFAIYPNPTNKTFNAVINSDEAGDANINISDITGKVLMSKTITILKGTQTITTDASQLAPGIYFVTFNQKGKVQTQKLVIMR